MGRFFVFGSLGAGLLVYDLITQGLWILVGGWSIAKEILKKQCSPDVDTPGSLHRITNWARICHCRKYINGRGRPLKCLWIMQFKFRANKHYSTQIQCIFRIMHYDNFNYNWLLINDWRLSLSLLSLLATPSMPTCLHPTLNTWFIGIVSLDLCCTVGSWGHLLMTWLSHRRIVHLLWLLSAL